MGHFPVIPLQAGNRTDTPHVGRTDRVRENA